jgi:DNA-directed RNA polymerase subunit RPC12/RpoP
MKNGEISIDTYERLKEKWIEKLSLLKPQRTLKCANCGDSIKTENGKKRVSCPSCGFVNKIITTTKKPRSPEATIINELSSIEEKLQNYRSYRKKIGPEAMQELKQQLSHIRYKLSQLNIASENIIKKKISTLNEHVEVLERYFRDYERFEKLGVNPNGTLNITFKAVVAPKKIKKEVLDRVTNRAKRISVGEAQRLDLEYLGEQQVSWDISEKETGFYTRIQDDYNETPHSRNPFVTSLELLEVKKRQGKPIKKKEKELLEIFSGWENKSIDAFRVTGESSKIFPERELLLSIEEKKKGFIRKTIKEAAIKVWKIATVWVPHWRLNYTSALGNHNLLYGALLDKKPNVPVSFVSLKKNEFLVPSVEGDAKEWLHKTRAELISLSKKLTNYERKFRIRTKKEDYYWYANPVSRKFKELGLEVEYVEGFLKMGLKVESKWLQKGEYEKIAASLELTNVDYVYIPAYLGIFQSQSTYSQWFFLLSLLNGEVAILSEKHPIIEIVTKGEGY